MGIASLYENKNEYTITPIEAVESSYFGGEK